MDIYLLQMNQFYNMKTSFEQAWSELGDIPVDEEDRIEEDFMHFPAGTDKLDIWHWFEETYNITLGNKM